MKDTRDQFLTLTLKMRLIFVILLTGFIVDCNAIAGGTVATSGQFPYLVSLRSESFGHICGGVIVSENLIVTAGACTDPRSPSIDLIVAGSLKRTENVSWQQVRIVDRTIVHPGYNGTTLDNDLSLLFLSEAFEFNDNISSIALPTKGIETFPQQVILCGWGNVQYGEPLFEDLQYVTLDTYSDGDCETIVGQYVRPEILCVGWDDGGRGGCQGDAGSPLVAKQGDNIYVSAVNSHFPCPLPDCCAISGPNSQCTELSFYVEWIWEQSNIFGGGLVSGVDRPSIMKYLCFVMVLLLLYAFNPGGNE